MVVSRFDVYFANLNPTIGSEINKKRPCVIISPDEMNKYLKTVIIAPMTTASKGYVSRVSCKFKGKQGEIVLDQIRTIDKTRLGPKLGSINEDAANEVLNRMQEIFSW